MSLSRDNKAMRLLKTGHWIPAKFDWDARQVIFRKIDLKTFREVPFHDGRHDFMGSMAETITFDTLINFSKNTIDTGPDRFILHPAFCGSTFLARLLSRKGRTACYREPQILIELFGGAGDPQAAALNDAIIKQFRLAPAQDEVAFVKPSNWANGYLLHTGALNKVRGVIIRVDLQSFLIANLRGGNERLKYSLNLLNHLVTFTPEHKRHMQEAQLILTRAPMLATLRLLAILHAIQAERFDKALTRPGSLMIKISHRDIQSKPIETALRVSDHLSLGLTQADITHQYTNHAGQHAKSLLPQSFSKQREMSANAAIKAQFGDDILKTIEWAEGAFPATGTG